MFSDLSLKYRIAIVIFVLEAVLMFLVLQSTLGQSYKESYKQIRNNENAIIELVSGISRISPITEEYAELQPYIEQLVAGTEATRFSLADADRIVVASSIPSDIGNPLPDREDRQSYHWRTQEITTGVELVGVLAVEFSTEALEAAYNDARTFGIQVALTGMIVIAAVGVLVGFLLTRRLARITEAAQRLSDGDFSAKTNIRSRDELGTLAATFDDMAQHLAEKDEQIREQLSELRDSEEKFRQLSENTRDVYWLRSLDLTEIYYVSPSFDHVWGHSREDLRKNPSIWIDSIHPEDRQAVIDDVALKSEGRFSNPSLPLYRIIRPDGEIRWIRARAFPVLDGDGNPYRIAGIAEDITDRRQAEQDREAALVAAESANQAKTEFLATMSHEFRTPLNAILGFSEILCTQYFGPLGSKKYEGYAKDIHASGELMLGLVNDILDVSAIEAGKLALVMEAVELNQALKDCIRSFEQAAGEKALSISLVTQQKKHFAWTDKRSVIQIVNNLMSNAVKFTGSDGEIRISVADEGDRVSIAVTDTGAGIPHDRLTSVTDPFTRVQSSPHVTQEGTGLGLFIVKTLIENQNGSLHIDSDVGKGTTVTVEFPAWRPGQGSLAKQEELELSPRDAGQ